jgi:hypothetical protein
MAERSRITQGHARRVDFCGALTGGAVRTFLRPTATVTYRYKNVTQARHL